MAFKMLSRARSNISVLFVVCLILALSTLAIAGTEVAVSELSASQIEEKLQECPLVQSLNAHKQATAPQTTSLTSKIFAVLFPGSPAVNAILATFYISGPPNFLLALCPTDIDPSSLSVMVAFAVGGLMGDTLFHLLPEIFLGEDSPEHARFVLVEPNRNLLLGAAILVGFLTFVAMDKALRIATGGEGAHDHSHDHKPASPKGEVSPSVKLGGYLNLIADFTHNITDGLAMSSSFYASPTIGATTTVAVFFHEIPHEVGDFALLVQSGFPKRKAMGAQFVTAELGGNSETSASSSSSAGLLGTSLTAGDLLLPFTAGTFLYVGTVAVIPELLETGKDKSTELRKTIKQFAAMFAGAGIMLFISWS
ncbi:zinc transporter YKE4 [Coccidioides immitis H538.4]|uniref:Zinc transporter YKE4 n=1 Tax=Coccidioides immitis H538.4 TaxID=396776 RepID=A0A0J8RT28_COCIT|nr:zinc transporter YKE4 [Coccidioides immitis H538.4]